MTTGSIFSLTNHELHLVTARLGERTGGQIASWVLPATLVPERPRVVVLFSPANHTHELVRGSGRFALNLLAEGQEGLVSRFGLHSGRELDKLAGLPLLPPSPAGLPLLEGTCGWAECAILETLDGGDRIVTLAEVTAEALHPGRRPLRKLEALARLPAAEAAALREKAIRDGDRDRGWIRSFPRRAGGAPPG
jgi:flavin reductase (DIM6/NTAB) family NADH-FMN oxidoreductase RutF